MVSVLDVIKKRQSVRKYLSRPIEDDKLGLILEAARLAPSSSNSQPWHFVVVKNKRLIHKLSQAVPLGVAVINKFMDTAPVVIVGCVKPTLVQKLTSLFGMKNYIIDISIAMEHMVLVAEEYWVGSCWIGWFDEKKVKKILHIPRNVRVMAMLTMGYPDEGGTHPTTRKSLEEIHSIDKY
ncbi:nitroreductase family protein [Candidatus Margulisiibacteriota bacterium]